MSFSMTFRMPTCVVLHSDTTNRFTIIGLGGIVPGPIFSVITVGEHTPSQTSSIFLESRAFRPPKVCISLFRGKYFFILGNV